MNLQIQPNIYQRDNITNSLDYISFDLYKSEDIRNLSVKQITESIAFDSLGRPIIGGIHDPSLGISPYDKTLNCATCQLDSNECPGHFGHIELPACLYNPFVINIINKLLNAKCFNCHKLRMRERDRKYYFLKVLLIKFGLVSEAYQIKYIIYSHFIKDNEYKILDYQIGKFIRSICNNLSVYEEDSNNFDYLNAVKDNNNNHNELYTSNTYNSTNINTNSTYGEGQLDNTLNDEEIKKINNNNKTNKENKYKKNSKSIKDNKEDYLDVVNKLKESKAPNIEIIFNKILNKLKNFNNSIFVESLNDQNTDIQLALKETIKEFWSDLKLQKCPYCNAFGIKVKKQGYLKFFKQPLNNQKKKKMQMLGHDIDKDALIYNKEENINILEDTSKTKTKEAKKRLNNNNNLLDSDNEDSNSHDEIQDNQFNTKDIKYLHPEEVREHIKRLWNREKDLLGLIFGNIFKKDKKSNIFTIESTGVDMFFIECILVTPNRFRPENRGGGDGVYLHQQSAMLVKILNISSEMRRISSNISNNTKSNKKNSVINESDNKSISLSLKNKTTEMLESQIGFKDLVSKWIELQDTVNILYDGQKAGKLQDKSITGIRQLIEKKEGIFRMKMMGKRVNHAGRSVISPDPMISTGEVGIPLYIASKLTIPEEVTPFNKDRLKQLILNGPHIYPGANTIETIGGKKIQLDAIREDLRINKLAKSLDNDDNNNTFDKFKVKTVYRHLQSGDALLVNRQPTLHRPSIMSHRAKVLKGEKTIRLHYANCSSYNADFDGDEMNIHFLQNHIARQEAYSISNTENQYINPTSGNPIRGLIQDSIVSGVLLTMKDNYFNRQEFFQLIYSALESSLNNKLITHIVIPEPAIIKPRMLWTGKQVITSILKSLITKHPIFGKIFINNITSINYNINNSNTNNNSNNNSFLNFNDFSNEGLNMELSTRVDADKWTQSHNHEATVIIRGNELLTGIIDKNQIGNSTYGIVHSYYELYGSFYSGELLTVLCKLFINYLQFIHGFTCGVEDLMLNNDVNLKRRRDIEFILKEGISSLAKLFEMKDFNLNVSNFSNRAFIANESNNKKVLESLVSIIPEQQQEAKRICRMQNFKIDENIFIANEDKIENYKKQLENKHLNKKDKKDIKNAISDLEIEINNNNQIEELRTKIYEVMLKDDSIEANLDVAVKSLNNKNSECLNSWIKNGLTKLFPKNYFSMMVLTGAKGSLLNHTLISCLLGQQELEGKRVPRMASGRTLPSFSIFDPNPRAGGFISDRFSTGIRIQEFFFHCMAGREGLIDTAVKTSRSGYLQRCLVKHLEQLAVNYDNTVRDNDGKIIQFLYGEDSIDPVNSKFVSNYEFLYKNMNSYFLKFNVKEAINTYGLDYESVKNYIENNSSSNKNINNIFAENTLLNQFSPSVYLGSKSNKVCYDIRKYINNYNTSTNCNIKMTDHDRKKLKTIVDMKYFKSIVNPGENVGIIAAQGIGEPSTQMTLNTFHLAGHGGANMTLGIPRLREILMTSENNIKTPIMILPKKDEFVQDSDLELLARQFEKYYLIDIIDTITIRNSIKHNKSERKYDRVYDFEIKLENFNDILTYFNLKNTKVLKDFMINKFIPSLSNAINKQLKLIKINKNESNINYIVKLKHTKDDKENKDNDKNNSKNDIDNIEDEINDEINDVNYTNNVKNNEDNDNQEKGDISSIANSEIDNSYYNEENNNDIDDININNNSYYSEEKDTTYNNKMIIDDEVKDNVEEKTNNLISKSKKDKKEPTLTSGNIMFNDINFSSSNENLTFTVHIPYTQKPILLKK